MSRKRSEPGQLGKVKLTQEANGTLEGSTYTRDSLGNLRRVRATGETEALVLAELRSKAAKIGRQGGPERLSRDSSFLKLIEAWYQNRVANERHLAPGTVRNDESMLRLYVKPLFGDLSLDEFQNVPEIEARLTELTKLKGAARQNDIRGELSLIANYGVRMGLLDFNPIPGTTKAKHTAPPVRAFTTDQTEFLRSLLARWPKDAYQSTVDPEIVADVVDVILGTSCRINEVCALQVQHIVCEGRRVVGVRVEQTFAVDEHGMYLKPTPKKDGQQRVVTVPTFTAEVLRRRLDKADKEPTAFLFTARRLDMAVGQPLQASNFRRRLRNVRDFYAAELAAHGIEASWITPHSFRRTGVTIVANQLGLEAARLFAGHESTETTRKHYVVPRDVVQGLPEGVFGDDPGDNTPPTGSNVLSLDEARKRKKHAG